MEFSADEVEKIASALHMGTLACRQFADYEIAPILEGQINRTDYEEILVGLYYRIALWIRSAAVLNESMHFQAIRVGARSSFETLLDIKALVRDPSQTSRICEFTKATKFKTALNVVKFFNMNPTLDRARAKIEDKLINNDANRKEYDEAKAKYWPGGIPTHWSGLSVRRLAAQAGPEYELMYVTIYAFNSMYVHGGTAGIDGLTNEFFVNALARGNLLLQESLLDATKTIATVFHLFEGKPKLSKKLEELRSLPQRYLAEGFLDEIQARWDNSASA
jgi:hypothetical protein